MLANPADAPTSLGFHGGGLGFSGIAGVAVALDTFKSAGNPSNNFVGITDGPVKAKTPARLHWLATTTTVPSLRATHVVKVALAGGTLTVTIDGTQVLSKAVTVGPQVMLGFTAGTGAQTDVHSVSNVTITAPPPPVTVGDPTTGGWTLNGSSLIAGGALQLTQASASSQAGSAFWPTPVRSANLKATFTTTIGGGTGADGMAFVVGNATDPPTALGASGGGLGFSGVPGVAVALDTYQNAANPSGNFVGVTDGPVTTSAPDLLHWLTTNSAVPSLRATHLVTVTLIAGTVTVTIDGTQVLSTAVTVGPTVLLGFSGGSGNQTDTHSVSNVAITAA